MKTIEQLTQELEAAKTEYLRVCALSDLYVDQRDEAVKLLEEYGRKKTEQEEKDWHRRYIDFLRTISSGETKVEELNCICSQGGLGFNIHNGIAYCKGCGYKLKETNSSNSEQENNSSCSEKPNSSPCKHLHVSGTVCTDCGEFANCSGFPDSSPESPWISVEDRMPDAQESAVSVIVTYKFGVCEGRYYNDGSFIKNGASIPEVTHWMPLPAPPESLTDKK